MRNIVVPGADAFEETEAHVADRVAEHECGTVVSVWNAVAIMSIIRRTCSRGRPDAPAEPPSDPSAHAPSRFAASPDAGPLHPLSSDRISRQIFVDPDAIRRADRRAASSHRPARGRATACPSWPITSRTRRRAEQPLINRPRIDLPRQRSRGAAPGDVRSVYPRVSDDASTPIATGVTPNSSEGSGV